ncbi:MAG: glycoside hydrolase family 38 C-terminal domain-containing protein [Gemmatimonadota bacterium]
MKPAGTRGIWNGAVPGLAALVFALAFPAPAAPQEAAADLPVGRWLVLGPLPADTGRSGVLRDYLGGEERVLPTPGDAVEDRAWTALEADSLGGIDLGRAFGEGTEWSAFYAHAWVEAPEERTVRLVVDSDDDIVVRVNGQRVWVNVVPRGLGPGTDTVLVRLARGWNSLLLKVVNRTGGAGVLGRLADGEPGGTAGLRIALERPPGVAAHALPAPGAGFGPLRVEGAARWSGGTLRVPVSVPVHVWGPDTLRRLHVVVRQGGGASAPWAETRWEGAPPGEPLALRFEAPFGVLRGAALDRPPAELRAEWAGGTARLPLRLDAAALLGVAGGRVELAELAVAEPALRPEPLSDELVVPPAFAGLSLDLDPGGPGPEAVYRVNGAPRPWRDGRVELCAPCVAGASLALEIVPAADRPLWLTPAVRVREPGYPEFVAGRRYAERLAGRTPDAPVPDPAAWLAALGDGDGSDYRALVAEQQAAFAPLAAEIRGDTLHLVGNSHIDAAWLWRWEETLEVIENTWRTSLKLAEIFPGYVFAGSSAAYYHALDVHAPALADSIRAAVADGRWVPVGGWWVESDQNLPHGESLIRQALYGQRYFERAFGARSSTAWTPDVFGYAWTMPQILRESGFERFVTQKIRWNDSTEFPHNAFFWEGNDGTRIFSYNPYGYVHDLDPDALVEQRLEDRERTGGKNQVVLYGVGDHGGGPTIEMLRRKEDAERIPAFPTLRFAGPDEAVAAVRAGLPDDSFPVWRDELYLEYHRGTYTTQAELKRRNRRAEADLQVAEALASVASGLPGGPAYPRARLERAWRQVLFNQFHDILPGSSIPEVVTDAIATYDSASATTDSLTGEAFAAIRAAMDTRGDAGGAYVLFNPLATPRAGPAFVDLGVPYGDGTGDEERRRIGSDLVLVDVPPVPALGAVAVRIGADGLPGTPTSALPPPAAGGTWIENAFLRVEVDPRTGAIVQLLDKTNGRQALRPGGRANVLSVHDDRPPEWDAWNIVTWGHREEVTRVTNLSSSVTSRAATLVLERTWGASTFRQTLVLGRSAPFLEVRSEVEWREDHKLLKAGFEPAASPDSATWEIPYGTIGRSGRPRTQAERAKFEVPGGRWADVSQDGYGLSVLTDGKHGWDYHDGTLRLSLLRSPTWPDSLADRGRHAFRFALYPHAGSWLEARTHELAAAYGVPLLAAIEPAHRGPLGKSFSLISSAPGPIGVEWVKRAEDSDALALRLVEWSGSPAETEVRLACPAVSARRANHLEDPGEALPRRGDGFAVRLRPFEIATVLVECGR